MSQITLIDRYFPRRGDNHDVEHGLGGVAVAGHVLLTPDRGIRAMVGIDFWARPIQVGQIALDGRAIGRSRTAIRSVSPIIRTIAPERASISRINPIPSVAIKAAISVRAIEVVIAVIGADIGPPSCVRGCCRE
jgi:hypothetical protein